MIFNVPKIKVGGIDWPIYSAEYSWGGADSPSSMTIDFVNKNGEYNAPVLGTDKLSVLELQNFFIFKGFPVSFTRSYTSQGGNLITVTYWDASIILDKIFVGLKGLHGPAPPPLNGINLDALTLAKLDGTTSTGSFDPVHIALVGTYTDPCEDVSPEYQDPCNPCLDDDDLTGLGEENDQKAIDCDVARYTQLLDVTYTFSELIAVLRSKGITFNNVPNIKNTYYGRYSGTAREVLKSWCSDLGFTFYWQGDGITFVDLKVGIEINDTNFYDDCSLISKTDGESIENNHATGNILYFGGEGALKDYNCSTEAYNSFRMSLIPITLADIFAKSGGGFQPYIDTYYKNLDTGHVGIQGLQKACLFAKHSRIIRDLVLLYNFYGVDSVKDAVGQKFPLLGIEIRQAYDIVTNEGAGTTPLLEESLKEIFWTRVPETIRRKATENGASMAVIKINQAWRDKFYDFEKKLADDFIGRYWISYFSRGHQYNYNAPDGSVDYFDAGNYSTLPFSDVIPESSLETSAFFHNIIQSTANQNHPDGGPVNVANPAGPIAKSFLLMDRQPAWIPTEHNENLRQIESLYKDIHFFAFEPEKGEGFTDTLESTDEHYALIFDRPANFNITTGEKPNPIEKDNENLVLELANYSTDYGLRSSTCRGYTLITANVSVTFYLPAQAHDVAGINYSGYTIVASKNSATDSKTNILIRRSEVILGDVPAQHPDSVGVIINFKDLTSTIQSIISETTNGCGYDVDQIRTILGEFAVKTAREKQVKKVSKSYTLAGFPSRRVTLTDGLASFSVRLDSTKGITTSLEFSNSPPLNVSDRVTDQEVEKHLLRRVLKKRLLDSGEKVTL